ncbi:maleylpyruvate isomerase family mycothiol-dependent enzyme [Gordonia sp. CPCC 206044]|uniref:maleylpyruvate isomerase family mycothiol-dependent enzyme n=1 Tax=Gordonia sp. CPCC 206044 TaxID=3140793 RepID=UPI003AF3AD82
MSDNTSHVGFGELPLDERLTIAREGTSWFARHLAGISDGDLDEPSSLPGWSRKHLVAHVGYNAAALTNLVTWASTGVETPMYPSAQQRNTEIEEGATLSAAALRNLFDHTAARLDEGWRHLAADRWDFPVRTIQGRTVAASETAWMRTREVWIHTVDLGSGATFDGFGEPILVSLFDDVLGAWRRQSAGGRLRLVVDDGAPTDVDPAFDGARSQVIGTLAAVVGWMCGRSTDGIANPDDVPPPRWL